jgi:triphosphoribosyl-dephospho-CoA synthase
MTRLPGPPAALPGWSRHPAIRSLGRAAVAALHDELALEPKPGLVSPLDSGSHTDMDAGTFLRSLFALRHSFVRLAGLGAAHAPFVELEREGVQAEARMLAATDGVNTHRGAIFALGLLCAGAGSLAAQCLPIDPASLRRALRVQWGEALAARHGQAGAGAGGGCSVALRLGLRGAGAEAALGFPVLFETALPALQAALAQGLGPQRARLQTLFQVMAVLDDTNLARRGSLAGLRYAQGAAREWLRDGGVARSDALAHARALHREFVARRLSPGGAADVLAAACWVQRVRADVP